MYTYIVLNNKERKLCKFKIKNLLKKLNTNNDKDRNHKYHIIIEALSKMIPMEAVEYEDDDGYDETGKQIVRRFYCCSRCHKTLYSRTLYCHNCGQKLYF